MPQPLSPEDRSAVHEALAEIRATPPPKSYAGVGCVLALPGFALLLIFPVVARVLELGSSLATPALVVGLALLAVGLILWFTAGGLARGHIIAAAEAALRTLEDGADSDGRDSPEDRDVLLRAATLLLCNAYATSGPSTVVAFDIEGARRRLGSRLALVVAVEEALLEEDAVDPVFTLDPFQSREDPPHA